MADEPLQGHIKPSGHINKQFARWEARERGGWQCLARDRRESIALLGAAVAWPLTARAQQAGKLATISVNALQPPPPPLFSITPGVEFTTSAWCYQRLAPNAPLDPNSAGIVSFFLNAVAAAGPLANGMQIPIFRVDSSVPRVPVAVYAEPGPWTDQLTQQFAAGVPIPPNFYTENQADAEAVIYSPATHELWEGWAWSKDATTGKGTWAPQPPSGIKGGMTAGGVHYTSFAVTFGDLKAQAINHPVGIVIPTGTARSDVWNRPPAWRCDGFPPQIDPNAVPYGAIFRLPANLDLNQFPATQWDGVSVKTHWRLVAEAIQNYGMIPYDQGGGWLLGGEEPGVYGGASVVIDADPILSQVMGNPHPWGYDNQYVQQTDFPFTHLQVLRMNLVGP